MAVKSRTDKYYKETVILEWYKRAVANKKNSHKKYMYLIPFVAIHAVECATDGDDTLAIKELLGKEMCQQGMYRVMGITDRGMQILHDDLGDPMEGRRRCSQPNHFKSVQIAVQSQSSDR